MLRIARDVPAFAGVSWSALDGEGFLLGHGADANAEPIPPAVVNG